MQSNRPTLFNHCHKRIRVLQIIMSRCLSLCLPIMCTSLFPLLITWKLQSIKLLTTTKKPTNKETPDVI